ncbi:2106_t:CDS:2, partial [Racocetra fulgida]
GTDDQESDVEEIIETSTEKRRRLAKQYIESIKEGLGIVYFSGLFVCKTCELYIMIIINSIVDETGFDAEEIDRDLIAERLRKDVLEQTGRAHRIIADTLHVFPGGRKEIKKFDGHTNHVLALAVSSDENYMGLVFRKGNNQLYSASQDRTIKVWNIDELYRTCRLWKIVEGSQLVFRGSTKIATEDGQTFKEGSLDVITMIDEDNFLSGGDSGEGSIKTPYWITALATVRYSDFFASGSWDGNIRLWKLIDNIHSFVPLAEIPLVGFVNALQFVTIENKTFLLAGVGQEHKLVFERCVLEI